jgi:hypothetical protein
LSISNPADTDLRLTRPPRGSTVPFSGPPLPVVRRGASSRPSCACRRLCPRHHAGQRAGDCLPFRTRLHDVRRPDEGGADTNSRRVVRLVSHAQPPPLGRAAPNRQRPSTVDALAPHRALPTAQGSTCDHGTHLAGPLQIVSRPERPQFAQGASLRRAQPGARGARPFVTRLALVEHHGTHVSPLKDLLARGNSATASDPLERVGRHAARRWRARRHPGVGSDESPPGRPSLGPRYL